MFPFSKKKIIASLVATVTLTSLIPFTVGAASKDFKEIEEEVSFDMVKVSDLDVRVYEDGRIKGLGKSKSQNISKNERKKILRASSTINILIGCTSARI
ncbi:hypothetical protein M655_001615 [Brevibacillus sp. NSP2.1]|uniref:hypothetical protein n=1 Tax=Brevibacillus sp. NSP2.1 TaxID=3003229 RepID=UPI000478C752|nr:hypothetical protein [Brevibacillus sp. NSP2.1]QHZ54454.1 hypothetical protein M655_001615 [Brevibacillus sp. NSP2.1]